jgi:hypothetical protein
MGKIEAIATYLTPKNLAIGILILLLVALSIYGSCARHDPDEVSALIQSAQQAIATEYRKELLAKDDLIKQAENTLSDYKHKLAVSEVKYRTVLQTIAKLKEERENVQRPETDKELRARFLAAGYPPLP